MDQLKNKGIQPISNIQTEYGEIKFKNSIGYGFVEPGCKGVEGVE